MSVPARPLPPFYYVDNFAAALTSLAGRDHDLLDDTEARFIREYAALPLPQRALIVRMALRQGPWYRGDSLCYPELCDPESHLAALKAAGWITDDPVIDVAQLIDVLPKTWLAEGFGLRCTPSLSKERMRLQALEIYPLPQPLSRTHFRLRGGLYEFRRSETCRRLCARYFGNHHQDWSEYVVADLGIKRYERVMLDVQSRPFTCREEIELFQSLSRCLELLGAGAVQQALSGLPAWQPGCGWLVDHHRDVALRIARQLEREGEPAAALEIYQQIESPEAAQRLRIVAHRLGVAQDRRPRFDHRSVPHFELRLSAHPGRAVEYRVAELLDRQEPGSEVIYAENLLINSLFGLLFWEAIFAPVRGAFFHAFHAAPADLHSPLFCARRQTAIDTGLARLDGPSYRQTIRENFRLKAGLLNRFVAWGWLRRAVLERALACIPAADLRLIFNWMLADLERNTAGFPDLLQLWPAEGRYRMVEVKLGADRLQLNQRRFLRYAQEHGLPVWVCYVSRPETAPLPRRAGSAPRERTRTLDLFPQDSPSA